MHDPHTGHVGCLMVPRLPLACELADRPGLWHQPVVVAHPDAAVAWSVSPAALAEGVSEGQRLSAALGRCPTLVICEARPARYEAQGAAMLDALERVAPGVEPADPGVAYVDLAGLVRAYGSAEAVYAALLGCVPGELRPRLGVGPTKFVASVAAFRARVGGEADGLQVVHPAEVATFMAPLAVEALPVGAEAIRRLRLVGLTTIGAVAALPRTALVAQFGPDGERLADLVSGATEPVRPRPRTERVGERLVFPEPLTSREALSVAADHLLARVLRHPRRGDRLIRQVMVRVETEQGGRWEATVTLRAARGDHDGIWPALVPVIERAQLPGPVSELRLELHGLRPVQGWQRKLLLDLYAGTRRERVEESLQQLRARYGRCPVGRVRAVEPWNRLPERRWALVELE